MNEAITTALIIIGFPVLRSAAGWAEKALKDNVVTKFEWKQLLQTIIRVGTIGTVAYFGLDASLSAAGIDVSSIIEAITAGSGAFLADKLFGSLKETKPVRAN